MATYTPNLGLIKPDESNPVLVEQINENSDVLDTRVYQSEQNIEQIKKGQIDPDKIRGIVDKCMSANLHELTSGEILEIIREV